jgi:uncharacterized protein (TIGR00255 family)
VLLSMTGFGEVRRQNERLAVTVELKSVNNKHLKVSVRAPDAYLTLEHDLEKLIRAALGRGTVYVNLYVDRLDRVHEQGLDAELLGQYWRQLGEAAKALNAAPPKDLAPLLALPGVVVESRHHLVEDTDWPLIADTTQAAITALQSFRELEGAAMGAELSSLCDRVEAGLEHVVVRAPHVVSEFRTKIRDRVQGFLSDSGVRVQDADLIREVSLFADRCDITEEITRLRCHIGQFRSQLTAEQSPGRKLDFLCQEMFREVNTIGSKGNDVQIAHAVVDMKTHVERMREIVQNVE